MKTVMKTIPIGSVTYAQKAKRALAAKAISSRLVKLDSEHTLRGCIYGVEVREERYPEALSLLRSAGLYRSIP